MTTRRPPGGLWERDDALSAVSRTLAEARDGRGHGLFLLGEAGAGKTTLLRAAEERARAGGFDIGVGRGEEMEDGIAWGLLEQVAGPIAGDAGDPDELLVAAVEPSAPYLRALRMLQARRTRPLLLVLDDLHWSDADSLQVTLFLARRLASLPVALIAALRPWPPAAHDAVRTVVAAGHGRLVTVPALSAPASAQLLSARAGGALPADAAARAWELCRGNPLLIEQYAASLAAPDRPAGDLLTARFAGLDEPAMRLLRCASVLGTSFRPGIAVDLAELDAAAGDAALRAVHASGLVAADAADRLRFGHPLLARALYDATAAPLRSRLHARAYALLARHGRFEEAAEQAIRAGSEVAGNDAAAALLERVGRTAATRGAVVSAARTLGVAVELQGDHAAPKLLLALADARCASGEAPAAAEVCSRLLERDGVCWDDRVAALVLLGRCQYLTGTGDHGEAVLERAVTLAEQHDPVHAVVPLLDQVVSAWMTAGPGPALPLAARARELAQGADPELRLGADAIWGHLLSEGGDPRGIAATEPVERRLHEGSVALAPAELVTPRASVYPYAHCAQYAERLDASLRALQMAREQIERAGAANALAVVSLFTGNHLIRRGRLREAIEEADRADRYSELAPLLVPFAAMVRAQALLWSGRIEESIAAEQAVAAAGQPWMIRMWLALTRGLRLLWAGDPAASDALLEVERINVAAGVGEPNHTQWAGHAIAAHLLAGRHDDAQRVLRWLERRAAVLPSRWPRFAATLGAARIAERAGDEAAALAGYEQALERLGDVDLPLQRVEGLMALGGLLRRSGGPREARPPLAEALRISERHGAAGHAARAGDELRMAGGRRRRAAADRDRLTVAERRVARAAADGLSNAEIARTLHLSVHTVESHLKRVYAKLDLRGRRQLVGVELSGDAD